MTELSKGERTKQKLVADQVKVIEEKVKTLIGK